MACNQQLTCDFHLMRIFSKFILPNPAIMKTLLISLAVLVMISGYAQPKTDLDGTWVLNSYVDHEDGAKTKKYGSNMLFQKHIAGCHFAWIKYDTKKMELIGMGGGTFWIDDKGNYIENLEFFYPFGSSELGQSIKFQKNIKGGKWYHTGYIKEMALNDQGELDVVDSLKIEEIWTRIKTKSTQGDLVGTWILQKSRTSGDLEYEEITNLIGYFKIITPTHFIWINYDAEGDQIYSAGVGTYTLKEGTYEEKIEAIYPDGVEQKVSFKYDREGKMWKHLGDVKTISGSYHVDEIWMPHICRPTDAGMLHD
jgi:hypothetical protein